MSEVYDPWKLVDEDHEGKCWMDDVKAARAAEATQHRQEIGECRAAVADVQRTMDECNVAADRLIARLAAVEVERDRLKAALEGVLPFVATQAMACGGMKCRETWCESCWGEDDARESAQAGADAMGDARVALLGGFK